MKILFITDEYLPVPSSNGACVGRLFNGITEPDEAFVLSVTQKEGLESTTHIKYKQYMRKPASFINRLFGFCQDDGYVNAIYTTAKEIILQHNIERVVCLCRPIEPLIAGIKLKKEFTEIQVLGYFLDNPAERMVDNPIKAAIFSWNSKRLLKKFHTISKKMVVLKYYKSTFSELFKNSDKVKYVGLPSIVSEHHTEIKTKNGINIFYGGSLNCKYRNPENVLKIIEEICSKNKNITVDFYSCGCEEILSKAKEKIGSNLKIHGMIPMSNLIQKMSEADVLLNVANDLPYAVPGKLFEYFSTGKPILNYIFRKDDPANNEYEKYPNIFNLYSYKSNDIMACSEFLLNSKDTVIPFSKIADLYFDSTPEYTLSQLLE